MGNQQKRKPNHNRRGGQKNKGKKHNGHNKHPHHSGRSPRQDRPPQEKKEFVPKNSLSEDQVGITEFVTQIDGFTGIIKSRFADFHVNEIDLSGNALRLTDLSVPQPKDDTLSDDEVTSIREQLTGSISAADWERIEALAAVASKPATNEGGGSDDHNAVQLDVSALSKETRTLVHKLLKKMYAGKLVSTTVTDESSTAAATAVSTGEKAKDEEAPSTEEEPRRFIKISAAKKTDRNRKQWAFEKDYVHFLVHKENMDTTEVTTAIGGRLGLCASQVNYCGTKDKRANTTQKCCVKRRTPSQILGATKAMRQVHVGNFEFSDEVLKLGQLRGNRFRIALRQVDVSRRTAIELAAEALRSNGFINYFGMQRFGNCATVPTHEVGVALLKSDYKLACELIMKPRPNDPHFLKAIREQWWRDRDSAAAAALFRGKHFIELRVLNGLAQYGENDYASALRRIPRNTLMLYVHAFQSLVFNRVLSRRMRELGQRLVVGDLVYRNREEQDAPVEQEVDEEEEEEDKAVANIDGETKPPAEADEVEQAVEATEEGVKAAEESVEHAEEAVASPAAAEEEEESIFKRKVRPLTAEDLAGGQYTLFDVVLPLPGHDITYPANEVAHWYEEVMQEFGLSSAQLRHQVKTYSLAGAYRRMMLRPEQMSWEFRGYDSPEVALIASDWTTLRPPSKNYRDQAEDLPPYEIGKEQDAAAAVEGKYTALLLDFRLPTCAYATMLLRELLKADTSAKNQIALQLASNAEEVQAEKRKLDDDDEGQPLEDQEPLEGEESKAAEDAPEDGPPEAKSRKIAAEA